MFICEYCGREIKNKGALVLHEKYCDKNKTNIKLARQWERENMAKRGRISIIITC